MKRMTIVLAATASLFFTTQANAQFGGLKDSMDSLGDATKDVAATGDISQESIVQNFLAANELVNETNAVMLEAFGRKEEAAKIREEGAAMKAKATEGDKDALKELTVFSQENLDVVASLAAGGADLSAEGRERYVAGLVLAYESVMAGKGMTEEASAFAQSATAQINSASMLQKAKVVKKLAAGTFVAKELPGYLQRLTTGVGSLVAYAKSADIPTPDDPTGILAAL